MTSHGNRTFRTHNISLTLAGGMNSQKHEDEKQIIARNIQYKHNNGKSRIEKQYFFSYFSVCLCSTFGFWVMSFPDFPRLVLLPGLCVGSKPSLTSKWCVCVCYPFARANRLFDLLHFQWSKHFTENDV